MNLTCECPNCSNDNAYFNGLNYECPDCDYEWSNKDSIFDNDDDDDEFLDETEKLELYYKKLDEQKVGESLNQQTFRDLYSPSWNFEKFLILYPRESIDGIYFNEIQSVLIKTKDFAEVIKLAPDAKLSEEIISKVREEAILSYLDNRDDLPISSTILDWSKYINAPESFIAKIFPKNGPNVFQQLPHVDTGDLTILFHKRIENLYYTLKSQKDFSKYGRFTLKEMKNIFTELSEDDPSEEYSDNKVLKGKIKNHFSTELNLISKYRIEWREGIFDHFINEAKDQKLSKIDTIVLILSSYFKEIMV